MGSERRAVLVEELPEERWDRIEGAVFDRLDKGALQGEEGDKVLSVPPPRAISSSRWRLPGLIALGGAIAAATGALVLRSALPNAELAGVAPATSVVTAESASTLHVGDADLVVGAETSLIVTGDASHGVLVAIDRGSADFEVAPRGGRPAFEVQAGDTRVRVIGTHFSVVRKGKTARVHVDHGVVDVKTPSAHVVLHDGESFPKEEPSEHASVVPVPSQEDLEDFPSRGGVRGSSTTHRRGATTHVRHDGQRNDEQGHDLSESRIEPSVTQIAPKEPAPVVESPQMRFERAASLERKDPAEALRLYREVGRGSSAWAANALFAAGRLEVDRGAKGDALRLLEEYLSRFPAGPNARDARDLVKRIE